MWLDMSVLWQSHGSCFALRCVLVMAPFFRVYLSFLHEQAVLLFLVISAGLGGWGLIAVHGTARC
jgi:hypothetical protein